MRATHLYGGMFMTALSLFCLIWLIPTYTDEPQSELDLSPAFMPTVAMSTCLLMAVIMTFTAWRASHNAEQEVHDEFGEEATGGSREVFRNLAIWVTTAVVSLALMAYVGFEAAMSLFLVVTFNFLGMRNYVWMAVLTIGVPIFLSLGTWYLFFIQMPGLSEHITPYTDPIMEALGLLRL